MDNCLLLLPAQAFEDAARRTVGGEYLCEAELCGKACACFDEMRANPSAAEVGVHEQASRTG